MMYPKQKKIRLKSKIDYIVSECKDLGIETRPQAEIDSLLKEWTESNERNRKISEYA